MGCKELIEALRASGDEKIKAIRTDAEHEAERIRLEVAQRIESVRADHARKRSAAAAAHTERLLSDANGAARRIRLDADHALSARLYGVARASLPQLRNAGYRDAFISFAKELPRFTWKTVRVRPEDADLAQQLFPDAEIAADAGITGGLEAVSEGQRVRVVNTFEKRLERLWEELLPDVMKDVAERGA
jgi:vacuolar-type H+-ATPase subunit E/Vma4